MKSVNSSNLLHTPPPVQKDLLKAQEGDKEVRELAKNITMPLLILWGQHDRVRELGLLSCRAIFLPPKILIYTTPYIKLLYYSRYVTCQGLPFSILWFPSLRWRYWRNVVTPYLWRDRENAPPSSLTSSLTSQPHFSIH